MALKGFYTGAQLVDEALIAVGDTDRRRYSEAVMYFLRGYRDFQLFNNEVIAESWLPISVTNTVNLPDDFMRLLWVGVSINGEVFSFTRSNKMVSPVSSAIDEELDALRGESEGIVRSPISGYGAKGINVEYYYGLDLERRRIVLKRHAMEMLRYADRSEALVGYVSHGTKDLDNTFVYADAANMLLAYMEWKLVESKPKQFNMSYMNMKKVDYYEAMSAYQCLNLPSVDELYDAIYETSGQNVRRI